MIASLMLDLDDAPDFPGNTATALGRPIAAYPFMAARTTGEVRRQYVVTSSPAIKAVALQNDAAIIDPPKVAGAEAALRHGFQFLLEELKTDKETLDLLVVFFANAPAVTGGMLQEGLEAMTSRPDLDSAVTAAPFKRFKPECARRLSDDGTLEPYAKAPTSDVEVWYPDYGAQILRPTCLDGKCSGQQPFPWLGKKVLALKQWGVGPIDYHWQVPSVEYWLKKQGFADLTGTMERQPQPKLQPKPKPNRR